MFRQGAKCLLITTLMLSIGFHWAILQSAAWAGMLVKYSYNASFSEAVQKTFDGKHPCKLCKFVGEGKQAEKKSEAQLDLKKLDFFISLNSYFYFPPSNQCSSYSNLSLLTRIEAPPTPPPLLA